MRHQFPLLRTALTTTFLTTAMTGWCPGTLGAQTRDSVQSELVARGVTHTRLMRPGGPWIIHVVRVDLRRSGAHLRVVRAHDQGTTRERVSDMVRRLDDAGSTVLAAVNADFFDLATGASENNQILDGEWWKGVRVTDSPYDTFDNIHTQFGMDRHGRPVLDRFAFDGWLQVRGAAAPLIALNAPMRGTYEGLALYTPRHGPTTPRDTTRGFTELTLATAGRRGDTLLFVPRDSARPGSGGPIPADGAVLAAFGPRADLLTPLRAADTVRVTMAAAPWSPTDRPAEPLQWLVGGWPRLMRDGVNVAARAPAEEGTISRNAEARHPRTAVGFSRDRRTLILATVDGRSTASVGMTTIEMAALMREFGAWEALNFDGGGSTAMVIRGKLVNHPSDATGERPVGNALMVMAPPRSP